MTKSTIRAFFVSMLSIMLCLTMLIGSTFAWFTDTATTGTNTITSGNLDLEFAYNKDHSDNWTTAEDATDIFAANFLWEPGATQVVYFKVTNTGSLALDYKVNTKIVKETPGVNKDGKVFNLSDFLMFGFVDTTAAFADAEAARAAIETPNTFSNVGTNETRLGAGKSQTFAIVIWMPEETDNEANHDGTAPEIQFGINVIASQANVESDGFNADYDSEAAFPESPKLDAIVANPKTADEFKTILDTAFTGGSASGTITINLEDDFDFANKWTTAISANYSGANTVVINGNGHYIKNMNAPLIEGVFGGDGTLTFNDLTIKDSTISAAGASDEGIGVFVNKADASSGITFNNCHISSVNITNTADNSTLGGFVGYSSAATLTFTNCSVKDSTFTGTKDIGALVGYTQSAITATDITVTGNAITSSNTSTYRVGALAGTFNSNPSTITTKDVSNNTITQANAKDPSVKTSDLAGRIYADVTVDGVALTKNN